MRLPLQLLTQQLALMGGGLLGTRGHELGVHIGARIDPGGHVYACQQSSVGMGV